jgi:hypothetical protein
VHKSEAVRRRRNAGAERRDDRYYCAAIYGHPRSRASARVAASDHLARERPAKGAFLPAGETPGRFIIGNGAVSGRNL